MLPLKRKREHKEEFTSSGGFSDPGSENDAWTTDNEASDFEAEIDFLQDAISKRNAKDGTIFLKKASNAKGKAKAKRELGGGSFQSMGLHPALLRSLTIRGFKNPTPIQRQTIPILLQNPPRDLVAMARTGSGKTLAYLIPLLHRLGNRHSATYGARALILVPSRELAVQVLRVGKELSRGWKEDGAHAGEKDRDTPVEGSKGALRWALVVGGEGLDEQFETMASNPDIIIATPGRLLHLLTEMSLTLPTIQYVVFDEADSLFSTLAPHINTLLTYLPVQRQTLLFSATLPKSIVEFAKAGLREPKLVRLDSETKLSGDLKLGFWWIREEERVAGLLALLQLIGVPTTDQHPQLDQPTNEKSSKKKRAANFGSTHLPQTSTIIFTPTQHHVSYLSHLLGTLPSPYSISAIHGSMPQPSRLASLSLFAQNKTQVLITTDVAARGLDLPGVGHVINFDFPAQERAFVHRVGRTARAGRTGWGWSFVASSELPHLLDLQLFLGRPLVASSVGEKRDVSEATFTDTLLLGIPPRESVDVELESLKTLEEKDYEAVTLRGVMERATKAFERTRARASGESYTRGKELIKSWSGETMGVNPAWKLLGGREEIDNEGQEELPVLKVTVSKEGKTRDDILKSLAGFRPSETVLEIGSRGKTAGATLMKERRKALEKSIKRRVVNVLDTDDVEMRDAESDKEMEVPEVEMADEDDIARAFVKGGEGKKKKAGGYRDDGFYLNYKQKDAEKERGYSLNKSQDPIFHQQATHLTLDLQTDDSALPTPGVRKHSQLKWDKSKKKFVKEGNIGADNVKFVKTESGVKVPVSYKSGRYEEWIKGKGRGKEWKIGDVEKRGPGNSGVSDSGKKWRHNKVIEAKPLDPLARDYDRKIRILKKKQKDVVEAPASERRETSKGGKPLAGQRWKGKRPSQVKNELKSVHEIRKQRALLEKKRAKNARASRKGRGRGNHG